MGPKEGQQATVVVVHYIWLSSKVKLDLTEHDNLVTILKPQLQIKFLEVKPM